MADRCKALYDSLEVQVLAKMTRSPGVTPDVGQLVWRANTTQPSSVVGDLEFYNGATLVATFVDCLLDDPQEQRQDLINLAYRIYDRRWKWQFPVLYGRYNVRDEKKELLDAYKKTPRELASLCLDALGESGYDVSALPTDYDVAPEVQWHYTPAAVTLDRLCALFGCQVHLLLDDTVAIQQIGIGTVPDDTGLKQTPEVGVLLNPAPDNIIAYADATLFDSWLYLDAVGQELDGTWKPINLLSYKPTAGWSAYDPDDRDCFLVQQQLRAAATSEEDIRKTVALVQKHIYRTYQVKGFAAGAQNPPGWTAADIGYLNTSGTLWHLVSDFGTLVSTHADQDAAETALAAYSGIGSVVAPNESLIDPRLLAPLERSRVLTGLNDRGEQERLPAEIIGTWIDFDLARNTDYGDLSIWQHGFSIDLKGARVTLGRPAFLLDGGMRPAELYLRTGYGVRQNPYGERWHRFYTKATGNTLGTEADVIDRTDLREYIIANYTDDYSDLSALGTPASNTTALDTALNSAATERLKRYQNLLAPQTRVYTPLRAVDTNGKVQQVTYQTRVRQFGETTVSVSSSHDFSNPPAEVKRIRDQQKKNSEKILQDFRSDTQVKIAQEVVQDVARGLSVIPF